MPKRSRSSFVQEQEVSEEEELIGSVESSSDDLDSSEEGSQSEEYIATISTPPTTLVGEEDSEDEVHPLNQNTVGDVPMHWYDEYDHIGYNILGQAIAKPAKKDNLDSFLDREDKTNWYVMVL